MYVYPYPEICDYVCHIKPMSMTHMPRAYASPRCPNKPRNLGPIGASEVNVERKALYLLAWPTVALGDAACARPCRRRQTEE